MQPGVEGFFRCWPQKTPSKEQLENCKIISHRGEHDNRRVFENTLAAFDKTMDHGIWGIELDVQWTKDCHPVVFHDNDCQRVFGSPSRIGELTLRELGKQFPLIPNLKNVIQRYGKQLHLMVELKKVSHPDLETQNNILEKYFTGLTAAHDYHLITLNADVFEAINFAPRSARLLVAQTNVLRMSDISLAENYGGITGHFYLLNKSLMAKHQHQNQKIGTGFPSSKNCLFREINRNVEWVFSNNALKLQAICNQLLEKS